LQLRTIGKTQKTDYVFVVLLAVFGVLTASRTFLVCLLTMLLLFGIGQKGSVRQKVRFWVIVVLVAGVSLFLLGLIFPTVLEYYIGRFFVEDITTGRDDLMVSYHEFITGNANVMFFWRGIEQPG
jgi:hypothetical protein